MYFSLFTTFRSIMLMIMISFILGTPIVAAQQQDIASVEWKASNTSNISINHSGVPNTGFYVSGSLGIHGSTSLMVVSKNTILDHATIVGTGAMKFNAQRPQLVNAINSRIENIVVDNEAGVIVLGELEITNQLTVSKGVLDASQAQLVSMENILLEVDEEAGALFIPPMGEEGFSRADNACLAQIVSLNGAVNIVHQLDENEHSNLLPLKLIAFNDVIMDIFKPIVRLPPPKSVLLLT